METLLQDLRYALRQLRRAPGFTVTAIVTLALGIGVTVTVAALVRQVLLAPLPYPQPQQIVGVAFHWPGEGPSDSMTGTAGAFLMRNARSFSAIAFDGGVNNANFSVDGKNATSVPVMKVSRGYFQVLGVHPALGGEFTESQDTPNGPGAVVLSYDFWKIALGSNPAIVGRTIHLDGQQAVVDGVMPEGFRAEGGRQGLADGPPAAWLTLQAGPNDPGYQYNNYGMIARLRAGVSVSQAQSELSALQPVLYHDDPFYNKQLGGIGNTRIYQVWPYAAVVASRIRPSLHVMSWAAAAVLLLTCLNLAGLNMARALHRAAEFSLRIALGAARGRLLRLVLIEMALLALCGGAAAVGVAASLLPFLLHASPVPIPQLSSAAGTLTLAAQAFLLALLCVLLFGAPLGLLATQLRTAAAGIGQRSAGASRTHARSARAIVVAQMGLSLVLLSVAVLLLGTFLRLRAQPLGFEPQEIVAFQTNLKGERYDATEGTQAFADQVVSRLRHTPGVSGAAAVVGLPLERGLNDGGWAAGHAGQSQTIELRTVTPGFLHTMGFNLLAGRELSPDDTGSTQHVAVISAAAAREFWPGQSAIGRVLFTGEDDGYRVVGIVNDSPATQLGQPPDFLVYTPMAQQTDATTKMLNGWFPVSFVAKTETHIDMATVARKAVASADPEIPVTGLTTMREVIDDSVAAPRFFTQIAEGFAAFALLLTAIGLFGLLSYQVTQRTREIGVRMALGASRLRVMLGVLRVSAAMAVLGGGIGVVGATLLHPLLTRWIMEYVAGLDATQTKYLLSGTAAVGAAVLALAVTVVVAAIEPARRASRVDPIEALRTE
jgi:predicted permease